MKNLIIVGVGGFAREVYWHEQNSHGFNTDWTIKGFLDGDVKLPAEEYARLPENVPVLGDVDNYKICVDDVFTCAIGTPKVRKKLIEKILSRGGEFVNLISKDSYIVPSAKIGRGVIFAAKTVVNDLSVIEDFVVINSLSGTGHDTRVGKYSCIMSGVNITGGTQIGEEVFIGSNAVFAPKAKVGNGAFVGAGSVILKKVRAGAKVFGNPAMEI